MMPIYFYHAMLKRFHQKGILEAGVDEAGRGCLAGPVTAAVVILQQEKKFRWYSRLNDSKKLLPEVRHELRKYIEEHALCWSVAHADHTEIDSINILNATYLAMHRAIGSLKQQPAFLMIDGNRFKPYGTIPHKCVVQGDGTYLAIAAASILAKTHRDELMQKLHDEYPHYGWNQNKAYATEMHRKAIEEHGMSLYHRRSFHLKSLQLELELEELDN
jgi:ribonuclease HII